MKVPDDEEKSMVPPDQEAQFEPGGTISDTSSF